MLRAALRKEFEDRSLWHSHNLVLETALQLGIVGLALFAVLMFATLREGWRLSASSNELAVACGIALIAIVIGVLLRNMTDVLWVRQNALLYWGIAGALLASRTIASLPRQRSLSARG